MTHALGPSGFRPSGRSVRAMVTAPHALAAQAGLDTLRSGGTAADAGVAIAAALSVLYPHMTGIGGDAFFLYYDAATRGVSAYNASGASAALADQAFYERAGASSIPAHGGLAALTVPGAVDAWLALHDRFGRLPLEKLLEPAITHARSGAPIARSFARGLFEEHELLVRDDGARPLYAAQSEYAIGEPFVQPALAKTLENIAAQGRSWWYEGEAAAQVEKRARSVGSPLRATDFAAHRGFYCAPLRSRFGRRVSLTTPPNSQGIVLLLAQNVNDVTSAREELALGSAAHAHYGIEAIKLAMEDRDEWIGDPRYLKPPFEELLSDGRARVRAGDIDPYRARPERDAAAKRIASAGDTTYFACVDEAGNALSMIQSLYFHFGSCVGVPELGIVLQNRGCSFKLDEGRPTSLAPGRLPFHTLMAAMLLDDDKPALVYGTMGGEGQPQTNLQVSVRIAERGIDPQTALDAPRWRHGRTWGEHIAGVAIEARAGEACIAGLRARGHNVIVTGDWEESMG
ncbi:MAG: gamma-glutamyltransferase family protein, partial [Candidatus Eremiobacteraeota bacterium]|nr:gamma-glutamyltransferase family protein [Candidatus Eremiobacteraeota bacterium]